MLFSLSSIFSDNLKQYSPMSSHHFFQALAPLRTILALKKTTSHDAFKYCADALLFGHVAWRVRVKSGEKLHSVKISCEKLYAVKTSSEK